MKKRVLSLLLAVALLMGLAAPTALAATGDYRIALIGTVEDFYDGYRGVNFDFRIQGATIGSTESIILKIDATKLQLARYNSGVQPTIPTTVGLSAITGANGNQLSGQRSDNIESVTFIGTRKDNVLFIAVQPTVTQNSDYTGDLTSILKFRLAFVGDTTEDDLDKTTVQVATLDEVRSINQDQAAVISDGGDNSWEFRTTRTPSANLFELPEPQITYPNSDVVNLNGVKLDAASKYANVPVSLPTTGADVTVATTPTAYYSAAMEDGTELTSGVTYTYGLQIKEGATTRDLTADEAAVISVGTDGVVTIKAGAPEAVVVITATGSYTNTKNNVSTASGTFELNLRHGDAHSKNDEDPSDPPKPVAGEPTNTDATKTLTGVEIYLNGAGDPAKVIAADATTRNYDYAVAKPNAGGTPVAVTFSAKELDQYGDEMTPAVGSWSMDDVTGITRANGALTIDDTVTNGDYVLTYTAGTITSTVTIKVADKAIVWPVLDKETITYGEKISDITFTGGTASDSNGTITGATFEWETPDMAPNAGSATAKMLCKNGTEVLGDKEYTITVNKADQVIAIDQDGDTPVASVDVEVNPNGLPLTLNTKVTNKAVPEIETGTTVSYAVDDTSVATVNNGVVTAAGAVDSNTKLTITAAGNDNYNEATREVTVYVSEQKLRATITFDKTNPVYGDEITATVTESADQPDSITSEVDYLWGYWDDATKTFTAKATGTGVSGNFSDLPDGVTSADVKYTPDASDIGKVLALKVATPSSGSATYRFIHSVTANMDNAVAKATWGGYGVTVKGTTYNSITVTGAEHAKFAIAPKNAPAAVDEAAGGVTDTHTWVNGYDETGAKDVVFTKSDGDVDLLPNTEYTVYMKMEATETHEESAVVTSDTKTKQPTVTPTPNPEDPDNPIPPDISGITVTAAIDETAGLKFDATLIASVTVTDSNTPAVVDVNNDFDWSYQWVRVTPVEGGTPTEEDISGATAATYKLAEDDIGKIIKVKVTTTDASKYAAVAETQTTDVIDKADGPAFTNTLGMEKAANATSTDGKITGLDANTAYEVAAKPAAPAEGEEAADPVWEPKTSTAEGKIEGVGAGTYLVRIPATTTHKASAHQEITVEVNGHNITGVVNSYNAKNAVTYELYKMGENGEYEETATYTGTAIEAAETTEANKQNQTFTIEGISDGTYKLVIIKLAHLKFTVEGVVVNGSDVDLRNDTRDRVKIMDMGVGDLDGNGNVTVTDRNMVTANGTYGATYEDAINKVADIDGNGNVTVTDRNIVTNSENYGKSESDFVIPAVS